LKVLDQVHTEWRSDRLGAFNRRLRFSITDGGFEMPGAMRSVLSRSQSSAAGICER
jgi:hypothetical protein